MAKLNKGVINYAARRGIELEFYKDEEKELLLFWDAKEDCEWMFDYRIENDGYHFNHNIYGDREMVEELPAWIPDDKKLKEVINFVAGYLNN